MTLKSAPWVPIALVAASLLTACAGPVELPEPTPSGTAERVCGALMAALPERVLDEPRLKVRPGRLTAAWGDPAITMRCGTGQPPGLGAASRCYEVNGVGWHAERATGGYLFTTIGRQAFVEVGVPSAYAPEANALVDLAAAVQRTNPVRRPCR